MFASGEARKSAVSSKKSQTRSAYHEARGRRSPRPSYRHGFSLTKPPFLTCPLSSIPPVYERLSPSFAAYLETLQAVHSGETFIEEVKRNGGGLWQGERGSPFNKNQDLVAVHPVVRTNPVTGKKAVFVNKGFTKSIVGLTVSVHVHY